MVREVRRFQIKIEGGKGGLYHEIDGDLKRRSSSSILNSGGSGSEREAQWGYLE